MNGRLVLSTVLSLCLLPACTSSIANKDAGSLGGRLGSDGGVVIVVGQDGGVVLADGGSGAGNTLVAQHHRNASRDGLYVEPTFTKAAVAGLKADPGFNATIDGNVFAQPLFMQNGPQQKDTVFIVTENNNVYALDGVTGAQLWKKNVGTPVPGSKLNGGSTGQDPLGITSTPVLDPSARVLYTAGMVLAAGNVPKHFIFAFDVDTGNVKWQVDVAAKVPGFASAIHSQRGALALVNGKLFVAYGGLDGDADNYKGRVVGVSTSNPDAVTSWAAAAYSGAGLWAPSGISSDGTNLFIATGNTNDRSGEGHPFPTTWTDAHSEAVLKLTPGTTFSGASSDYFTMQGGGAPSWLDNDKSDSDLGSAGLVLFDAPGATPSHLAFVAGKTQHTYLLNRDNLGGMSTGLAPNLTTTDLVMGAMFAYNTTGKTYVGGRFLLDSGACQVAGADLSVLEVSRTSPPALSFGWCGKGGRGGAIVSTSDGLHEAIVWTYSATGDEKIRAYDGDNGTLLFTSSALPGSSQWISPIIAKGRIYVAGNGSVSALKL